VALAAILIVASAGAVRTNWTAWTTVTRELAGRLAAAVRVSTDFELRAQGLSIVCFRYAPPERRGDAAGLDGLNRGLLDRLQAGGRAFLSSTVLDGAFWLRACIVNPRTTEADVDALLDIVRECAE
jgi:glutamate/tyrosine decarboxylase-like PLP-dependent enzyme